MNPRRSDWERKESASSHYPQASTGASLPLQFLIDALGIAALVRAFARPLNDFTNDLLLNHKVENRQSTKVVPIISFGDRKAIGAAQVSGTDQALVRVRAVILYENLFRDRRFRVKAMVPGDSADPRRFSRVYGVGVTAVIDVKI